MSKLVEKVPAELAEEFNLQQITDIVAYTVAGFLVNFKTSGIVNKCRAVTVVKNTVLGYEVTVKFANYNLCKSITAVKYRSVKLLNSRGKVNGGNL